MTDWAHDLEAALADGSAAVINATLARVPREILERAVPYLQQMARISADAGQVPEALTYYGQLIELAPDNVEWLAARANLYLREKLFAEALADAARLTKLQPEGAFGYRLLGQAAIGLSDRQQALASYREAQRHCPEDAAIRESIRVLTEEIRKIDLLNRALNPDASNAAPPTERTAPPAMSFDPALLATPSMPDSLPKNMVLGLVQHLRRYSSHQSSKNALRRLDHPAWLTAWDNALAAICPQSSILLRGSELGVLAARAIEHGATRVVLSEAAPLDQHIATGVTRKHLLAAWHATNGELAQSLSEAEREASFAAFTEKLIIVDSDRELPKVSPCDYFVFTDLDHTLLGTGIAKAVRLYQQQHAETRTKVIPSKARVYAMAIEWVYAVCPFDLAAIAAFRWSLYPEALEASSESWRPLSEPTLVGEIDFNRFAPTTWLRSLSVTSAGKINAIVFWHEIDLGTATLTTAPGSLLPIQAAVQYTDEAEVSQGQTLSMRVRVEETRLLFQIEPGLRERRSHALPSWFLSTLHEQRPHIAYEAAMKRAVDGTQFSNVLNIGAGVGLLSMLATRVGAEHVLGCETDPVLCRVGADLVRRNGFAGRVALANKECRQLTIPEDLAERAGVAVFDSFDCSLIGEGILHFLAYAREHLLSADARYVPMAATLRGMIVEYRVDRVLDVDVNILNPYRFSPSFVNVDASKLEYRPLTDPVDLFSFDFSSASPAPEQQELMPVVIDDGIAGAVLFWFDLKFDETLSISNSPAAGARYYWRQGLQFLPEVRVTKTMSLPLVARHDGSRLVFHWKPGALSAEQLSSLPRFDPRSLQQARDLEHETQQLLQHCMQDPTEFSKVAEVAQRFAIDPARHHIDPIIAQRFAAIFFRT
jgi:type III protein arginine methyltransferase